MINKSLPIRLLQGQFINRDVLRQNPAKGNSLFIPEFKSDMRVMTYNIRAGRSLNGQLNLDRIAKIIADESPDIVALQEVDSQLRRSTYQDQAHILAHDLGYNCAFVYARRWKEGEYGNAILSRFPILECCRLALPKPPHLPLENRSLLQSRLAHPQGDILVWNTHLGLLATERRAQVSALLQELVHNQDKPLILLGDFNARPRSKEINGLSLHLTRAKSQSTFPGILPVIHLDHIFYSHHLQVHQTKVVRNLLARKASDHLPLVAELQLTDNYILDKFSENFPHQAINMI